MKRFKDLKIGESFILDGWVTGAYKVSATTANKLDIKSKLGIKIITIDPNTIVR